MDGCLDRYQVKLTHKHTSTHIHTHPKKERGKEESKVKAKMRTDGNQRAVSNEKARKEQASYLRLYI